VLEVQSTSPLWLYGEAALVAPTVKVAEELTTVLIVPSPYDVGIDWYRNVFEGVVPKLETVAVVAVVWFLSHSQLELSPEPAALVSSALKAPAVEAALPCKQLHLVL
jgi:hypothetical protein